jgi:hypothetical protein
VTSKITLQAQLSAQFFRLLVRSMIGSCTTERCAIRELRYGLRERAVSGLSTLMSHPPDFRPSVASHVLTLETKHAELLRLY